MLPAKPVDDSLTIAIPEGSAIKVNTLLDCGEIILRAVAKGEITPDQGKSLIGIIETQRKNIETSELATRLVEIERTLKQRKKEK